MLIKLSEHDTDDLVYIETALVALVGKSQSGITAILLNIGKEGHWVHVKETPEQICYLAWKSGET